jgi:uncharacterized protein YybS (DUF2232 family)
MLFFFSLMSFIFLFLLKKNVKWIITILAGLLYFNLVLTGLFFMMKSTSGQNAVELVYSELNKSFNDVLSMEKKAGATQQRLTFLENFFNNFIIKILPSWIICVEIFLIFLDYLVVRIYAVQKYNVNDGMKPFALWKLNENVVWLLIACLGIFAVDKNFHNDIIFTVSLNGTFLLAVVYFIAGLAVVTFYLIKFSVPPFAQFFIYAIIVMWAVLSFIIILAGIFDTWFNFRKIKSRGDLLWK